MVGGIPRVPLIISPALKTISYIEIGCSQDFKVVSLIVLRAQDIVCNDRVYASKVCGCSEVKEYSYY